MTVQLAWLWNSTTPAAPSGRLNATPNTDNGTPIANDTMHIPNGGGGGVDARTTTTEAIGQAQQGKIVTFNNASSIAVTVNTPTDSGWKCAVFVTGAGPATFTPSSGTINGASNLSLTTGQNGVLWWDGTNYEMALAGGPGTGLVIEVAGTPTSNQSQLFFTAGSGITITNPSGGVVNIAASGGSSGPSPSKRRWAYGATAPTSSLVSNTYAWVGDNGAGSGVGTIIYIIPTGSSTFNIPITNAATAASGNSNALILSNSAGTAQGWVVTGKNYLFQTYAGTDASVTSVRIRFGVGATASAATWLNTDTITSVPYAAFRFSTNVPDTNWQCETGDGSAATVVDSGVAVIANTLYNFQIQFNDGTPNVVFSINGSVVATITTHLPGANKALSYLIGCQCLSASARKFNAAWIYEEADN